MDIRTDSEEEETLTSFQPLNDIGLISHNTARWRLKSGYVGTRLCFYAEAETDNLIRFSICDSLMCFGMWQCSNEFSCSSRQKPRLALTSLQLRAGRPCCVCVWSVCMGTGHQLCWGPVASLKQQNNIVVVPQFFALLLISMLCRTLLVWSGYCVNFPILLKLSWCYIYLKFELCT